MHCKEGVLGRHCRFPFSLDMAHPGRGGRGGLVIIFRRSKRRAANNGGGEKGEKEGESLSPGSAGREGNSLCAFKGEEGGRKVSFFPRPERGGRIIWEIVTLHIKRESSVRRRRRVQPTTPLCIGEARKRGDGMGWWLYGAGARPKEKFSPPPTDPRTPLSFG